MANPALDSLKQQVERTVGVLKSAKMFIDGFGQRLTDAIAAALANGATAEELAPLQTLSDNLKAETDALAAAIAANPG